MMSKDSLVSLLVPPRRWLGSLGIGSSIGIAVAIPVVLGCGSSGKPGSGDPGDECAATEALCGNACVDTSSDPNHCGSCEVACPTGQRCVSGSCTASPEGGSAFSTGGTLGTGGSGNAGGSPAGAGGGSSVGNGPGVGSGGIGGVGAGSAATAGSAIGGTDGDGASSGGSGAGGSPSGGGPSGGTPDGGGVSGGTGAGGASAGVTAIPGGASNTGGAPTGGVSGGVGGSGGTGGETPLGGGPQGGAAGSGGASDGGSPNTGGAPEGGTPGVGSCGRPVGSCTAPGVTVTDIDVGVPVTPYGQEGDTDPLPLAISAVPSGGSRLAWLGTDERVYVASLDCGDRMVGTPFSFPAVDLQDIYADDDGGVVLLTRDATNGGTDQCGSGQLCGGSSSPCRAMYLVRFNAAGEVQWETQVTNLSSDLAGYQDGARFVWWYQHHGRIAFDGSNYGAYFCIGITVNNNACVDIHEGDRMQVVSSNGTLVNGHEDTFDFGCSHSWVPRIVWDPRTDHFVMVCTTDNDCRIAQPKGYKTVASGTCDGTLFGGDLVLASTSGYWTAWSQGEQIRLEHFTTGASDQTIESTGRSSHPHLVTYGPNHMLLAWGSGSGMSAQVHDSGTGAAVGDEFTIEVNDHDYQALKAYPDGSVAYPGAGANATTVRVARVMPCGG